MLIGPALIGPALTGPVGPVLINPVLIDGADRPELTGSALIGFRHRPAHR